MFWLRAVTVDGSHNLERDFLSPAHGWWHKLDRNFSPFSFVRSFRATRAVLCCVLIPTNETDGSSAASCHGELCVLIHACRVFMQTFRSTYHGYWDILTTTRINLLTVMEVKDPIPEGRSCQGSCWRSFIYIHLRSLKDTIYLIWILELLVSCRWRRWEGKGMQEEDWKGGLELWMEALPSSRLKFFILATYQVIVLHYRREWKTISKRSATKERLSKFYSYSVVEDENCFLRKNWARQHPESREPEATHQ